MDLTQFQIPLKCRIQPPRDRSILLRLRTAFAGHRANATGYLLTRAPAAERSALDEAIDESLRVLPELVAGEWERATTALHTRTRPVAERGDGDES